MAGLLDGFGDFIKTPEGQGLLSMAFGGLAGARSGQPLNSLGRAGIAGLSGYAGAQDRQMKQAEEAQLNQYRAAQMANMQAEADTRKQALDLSSLKRSSLPGLFTGGRSATSPLAGDASTGILASSGSPAVAPSFDINKAVASGLYTPQEIEAWAKVPNAGMTEVARTMKGMQGGKEVDQQYDKYGRPVGQGVEQYKAPLMQDLGGNVSAFDPYTLAPRAVLAKSQSPDSKASNALGWANHGTAATRLNWDMNGGGDGGISQSGFNKQFGKPSAGFRWKPDGSQEFIPGGPADQKAQMSKVGEGTVQGVVADLRDKYTNLDKENGIVSTNNRIGTNLGAAFGASGVGQYLNGAVGTKTQSSRDSIAMTRPLLLQAIMKATGMSSKQMDSNAELKLYLATATDPQKGLEANLEALDRIESLYGGGSEKFTPRGKQAATDNGWGIQKVGK